MLYPVFSQKYVNLAGMMTVGVNRYVNTHDKQAHLG